MRKNIGTASDQLPVKFFLLCFVFCPSEMSPRDQESHCSLIVEVIRGWHPVLLSLKCPMSPNSVGLMTVRHHRKTSAPFYSQLSPSLVFEVFDGT